jgi:amidophosphoribosyltransferase
MLEREDFSNFAHDNRLAREAPRELNEKCAVFGIINKDAAILTNMGLFALQHRGQESSGISVSDGNEIRTHKATGLVAQVYSEQDLAKLEGSMAVGHNRYGTSTKETAEKHVQPVLNESQTLALVHNGNLPDTTKLEAFLSEQGISPDKLNDSEMMHAAIAYFVSRGATLENAVYDAVPYFTGSFSFLAMDKEKIVAVRDQRGIRPLSIGLLNGGYIFSSETCAIDMLGAKHVRDVAPGEMVIAPKDGGLFSTNFAKGEQRLDIFEFVYFSRPDSYLLGQNVHIVREKFGEILWEENHVRGDIVISVLDSGTPAAQGYAAASGIPYRDGLVKTRYAPRTFIQPGQEQRVQAVRMKLNPLKEVIKDKSLILVDDSIVRGTTARAIVALLRQAGAREVHMVITSPPVKFPDFYGIDTPKQSDLIAAQKSIDEVRRFIGADSLNYLSYDGMIKATGIPEEHFSTACFTGIYPIDIGKKKQEISFHPQ